MHSPVFNNPDLDLPVENGDARPLAGNTIRLAEIVEALSKAIDLTEGQPVGHCVRVSWIGTSIGRAIGMSEDSLADLFYTLLLKDLGCTSNAARICELYLVDDLMFKRDFKLIDGSLTQALPFRSIPYRYEGRAGGV